MTLINNSSLHGLSAILNSSYELLEFTLGRMAPIVENYFQLGNELLTVMFGINTFYQHLQRHPTR